MEEREEDEVKMKEDPASGGGVVTTTNTTFPLHKAAFEGNVRELASLLRKEDCVDISQKDRHGKRTKSCVNYKK
jgi:hypothetical protein